MCNWWKNPIMKATAKEKHSVGMRTGKSFCACVTSRWTNHILPSFILSPLPPSLDFLSSFFFCYQRFASQKKREKLFFLPFCVCFATFWLHNFFFLLSCCHVTKPKTFPWKIFSHHRCRCRRWKKKWIQLTGWWRLKNLMMIMIQLQRVNYQDQKIEARKGKKRRSGEKEKK